jgi:hypothetical protein
MTSDSSSSRQDDPSGNGGRSTRSLFSTVTATTWIGAAAIIIAALISAGALIYANRPQPSAPETTPASKATAASVTIKPPPNGEVPWANTLTGRVHNLQRGQSIWTFSQSFDNNAPDPNTYPNTGPCTVDYANHEWTCPMAYIGNKSSTGPYHVCAGILTFGQAFDVVALLENTFVPNRSTHKIYFMSPPSYIHEDSKACMNVTRTVPSP